MCTGEAGLPPPELIYSEDGQVICFTIASAKALMPVLVRKESLFASVVSDVPVIVEIGGAALPALSL